MNELDEEDERASEAAAKLAGGIKSCRSVLKNYRLMFAEQAPGDPAKEQPEQEQEGDDPPLLLDD